MRYATVQHALDLSIGYPDALCLDLRIDALVQLLFGAMHRQFAALTNETLILPLRRFHDPCLLFLLQVAPFLVGLQKLAVYANMVFQLRTSSVVSVSRSQPSDPSHAV